MRLIRKSSVQLDNLHHSDIYDPISAKWGRHWWTFKLHNIYKRLTLTVSKRFRNKRHPRTNAALETRRNQSFVHGTVLLQIGGIYFFIPTRKYNFSWNVFICLWKLKFQTRKELHYGHSQKMFWLFELYESVLKLAPELRYFLCDLLKESATWDGIST